MSLLRAAADRERVDRRSRRLRAAAGHHRQHGRQPGRDAARHGRVRRVGQPSEQRAARLPSEARLRQFLADASPELRTPLTSIPGYAELARMQRRAAGVAPGDDNLDRIEAEGTRMSRLVEDLLTLARSDRPEQPL